MSFRGRDWGRVSSNTGEVDVLYNGLNGDGAVVVEVGDGINSVVGVDS